MARCRHPMRRTFSYIIEIAAHWCDILRYRTIVRQRLSRLFIDSRVVQITIEHSEEPGEA